MHPEEDVPEPMTAEQIRLMAFDHAFQAYMAEIEYRPMQVRDISAQEIVANAKIFERYIGNYEEPAA